MIDSKDITKMVTNILKRDKGVVDVQIMHPTREWFIGLSITTVVVVAGSWFCFYLYQFYSHEMKKEVVVIEQAVPYQAATVKSALELFAAKNARLNKILGGSSQTLLPEQPVVSTSTAVVTDLDLIPTLPEAQNNNPTIAEDGEISTATLAP